MRSARALLAAAIVVGGATAAEAREPLGLSLTLATDHRSKGASKSGGRPQAEVGYERDGPREGYFGGSVSTIRNSAGSDAQINLSLGWRPEAFGVEWDFNSTHEIYPGSRTDGNDVVWQLSAEAERDHGPLTAAAILQHQPDGFGPTRANTYLAVEGLWRLRPRLEAVAGLGRREQDGSVDYTAWNAGVVLALTQGAALDVRWHATDQDELGPNYEDRLVAAIELDF